MKKNATLALIVLFAAGIFVSAKLYTKVPEKEKVATEKVVAIITELGTIKVKLYNETPLHRDNFLKLVKSGEMNGSTFHRVIKGFMIQGGGKPGSNGTESIGETIPAEIDTKFHHKKGALCAARMGDNVNPQKKSSGSQFYIVHGRQTPETTLNEMSQRTGIKYSAQQIKDYATLGGTPHLDGQYTVFGEVVSGLDIVDKIAAVAVTGTVPVENITIKLKTSK